MKIVIAAALLAVGSLVRADAVNIPEPLPIEAALKQKLFPPFMRVGLSADGQWAAYTVQRPGVAKSGEHYTATGTSSETMDCEIWVTHVGSGQSIQINPQAPSTWAPAWSPTGNVLAFYSDADGSAGLWVWSASDRQARRVSDAIVRPVMSFQGPRWLPDGRRVATRIIRYGSTLADARQLLGTTDKDMDISDRVAGATAVVYRSDAAWKSLGKPRPAVVRDVDYMRYYRSDVAVIDVQDATVTTIARDAYAFDLWPSPDGRYVGVVAAGDNLGSKQTSRIFIASVDGASQPQLIAHDVVVPLSGGSLAWSPDGAHLAYVTNEAGAAGKDIWHLADSATGRSRRLAEFDTGARTYRGRPSFPPRWAPDGRTLYALRAGGLLSIATADARVDTVAEFKDSMRSAGFVAANSSGALWLPRGTNSLVVHVIEDATKQSGFARIDLKTGAVQPLWSEKMAYGTDEAFPPDVSGDGRSVIYLAQGASHPPELWLTDDSLRKRRQLTNISAHLQKYRYGEARLISWALPDGTAAQGTLLLPSGYVQGRRYPLLVEAYPLDRRSGWVHRFGGSEIGGGLTNMQLFATRGYAVLLPDLPLPQGTEEQNRDIPIGINAAVDRVIELGIADPERMAISGQSWGGYMVLSTITQTDRFKAAVARGSYSDLMAIYGTMYDNGYARGQGLIESWLQASPWEDSGRYIRNSPIYRFDAVRTPLLLIHGEAEENVFDALADQTFVALRRLDKEVEYAKYGGEGHAEIMWTLPNQKDFIERQLRWFDRHLR